MANFGDLYSFNTANGIVIPQTSDVKLDVERAFKDIFGGDFSTDPNTINGRLIEAMTMFFVDVCGVGAQNANGMNITQAVGLFLDSLGAMFGINREQGETDNAYRRRILASQSRGSGFAQSLMQAIGNVGHGNNRVSGVVVLDNGNEDPDVLPKDKFGQPLPNSISVAPHSVFISVMGGEDEAIAEAIRATKSAGCGYSTSPEFGTATVETIVDSDTGTSFTAKFYRPTQRYVSMSVLVNGAAYTGDNISLDTQNAIKMLMGDNRINVTISKADIISAVAALGKNIVAKSVSIFVSDSDPTLATNTEVDSLVVMPYKYISPDDTTINVTVE